MRNRTDLIETEPEITETVFFCSIILSQEVTNQINSEQYHLLHQVTKKEETEIHIHYLKNDFRRPAIFIFGGGNFFACLYKKF